MQHCTGRLYYPAAPRPRGWLARRLDLGVPLLPHPLAYAHGLARFFFYRRPRNWLAHALRILLHAILALLGALLRLDLHPGAPAASTGGQQGEGQQGKGQQREGQQGEAGGSSGFPVVLFSHGLGGHRSLYSMLCAELASQGYVVFAAEHADGTASTCRLAGGQVRWRGAVARRQGQRRLAGRGRLMPGLCAQFASPALGPTGCFLRGPPRRAGSFTTAWAGRKASWPAPGSAPTSCALRCAS
jgi:hypothetical protein